MAMYYGTKGHQGTAVFFFAEMQRTVKIRQPTADETKRERSACNSCLSVGMFVRMLSLQVHVTKGILTTFECNGICIYVCMYGREGKICGQYI